MKAVIEQFRNELLLKSILEQINKMVTALKLKVASDNATSDNVTNGNAYKW